MGTIQSLSISPLGESETGFALFAQWCLTAVAFAVPPLDKATKTEWLLYLPPSVPEFAGAASALVLYAALIVVAGLFDFQRRNL
jgi:hypothetical protein